METNGSALWFLIILMSNFALIGVYLYDIFSSAHIVNPISDLFRPICMIYIIIALSRTCWHSTRGLSYPTCLISDCRRVCSIFFSLSYFLMANFSWIRILDLLKYLHVSLDIHLVLWALDAFWSVLSSNQRNEELLRSTAFVYREERLVHICRWLSHLETEPSEVNLLFVVILQISSHSLVNYSILQNKSQSYNANFKWRAHDIDWD